MPNTIALNDKNLAQYPKIGLIPKQMWGFGFDFKITEQEHYLLENKLSSIKKDLETLVLQDPNRELEAWNCLLFANPDASAEDLWQVTKYLPLSPDTIVAGAVLCNRADILDEFNKRKSTDELKRVVHNDQFLFNNAAKFGCLDALKKLAELIPEKKQALIKEQDYQPLEVAAANGHLDVVKWLVAEVDPSELHDMITARRFAAFEHALPSVRQYLLTLPSCFMHAVNKPAFEQDIKLAIPQIITNLREQKNKAEFKLSNDREINFYFHVAQYLIARNDPKYMEDIKFLLEILEVKNLVLKDIETNFFNFITSSNTGWTFQNKENHEMQSEDRKKISRIYLLAATLGIKTEFESRLPDTYINLAEQDTSYLQNSNEKDKLAYLMDAKRPLQKYIKIRENTQVKYPALEVKAVNNELHNIVTTNFSCLKNNDELNLENIRAIKLFNKLRSQFIEQKGANVSIEMLISLKQFLTFYTDTELFNKLLLAFKNNPILKDYLGLAKLSDKDVQSKHTADMIVTAIDHAEKNGLPDIKMPLIASQDLADRILVEQTTKPVFNLCNLSLAINKATKRYCEWYKTKDSHFRGRSTPIFTFFRHGQTGQKRARLLHNKVTDLDDITTATNLINEFLKDDKTRYHRHSFASFLLDELKKLENSPWSKVEFRKDKPYHYDKEQVINLLSPTSMTASPR